MDNQTPDKQETPRTENFRAVRYLLVKDPEQHIDKLLDSHGQLERELAEAADRLAGAERHVAVLEGTREAREEEALSATVSREDYETMLALKDHHAQNAEALRKQLEEALSARRENPIARSMTEALTTGKPSTMTEEEHAQMCAELRALSDQDAAGWFRWWLPHAAAETGLTQERILEGLRSCRNEHSYVKDKA